MCVLPCKSSTFPISFFWALIRNIIMRLHCLMLNSFSQFEAFRYHTNLYRNMPMRYIQYAHFNKANWSFWLKCIEGPGKNPIFTQFSAHLFRSMQTNHFFVSSSHPRLLWEKLWTALLSLDHISIEFEIRCLEIGIQFRIQCGFIIHTKSKQNYGRIEGRRRGE